MTRFCNLHQHTTESHLDAICDIDALFDRAKELGQRAIAVTDHGTMGGIYRAYKASVRTGVKLIPGNEIYFTPDLTAPDKDPETKLKNPEARRYHLVLLASNEVGYRNLLRITYEGFKNSVTVMGREFPRVDEAILRKYSEGLFALSACGGNIIAQTILTGDEKKAISYAQMLKKVFGERFFIELQPHGIKRGEFSQIMLNKRMKEIAEETGIEMVATCDAHYIKKSDEKFHDMVLAISDRKPLEDLSRHTYTIDILCDQCTKGWVNRKEKIKCTNPVCIVGVVSKQPCNEFYLKDESEILSFFSDHFDSAFANRLVDAASSIVDRCEVPTYIKPSGVEHIPKFDMSHISQCEDASEFKEWAKGQPKGVDDDALYMRFLVKKGFDNYMKIKGFDHETKLKYWKRAKFEVSVLESRKFSSYILIVADYIRWARNNDVLVGPGRGSCGGSLVAFFLRIHLVDPIMYGLYFERFHNLQKKSLPDIDTDFAPSGRKSVYEYCSQKYGKEHVAYISNLTRFTPKVVITDVIRSLLVGGDKSAAFKLAKEITSEIPDKIYEGDKVLNVDTLEKALKHSKGTKLRDLLESNPDIMEYANAIVGLPKNYSTHAGGVIISDIPLPEFIPVRRDKEGSFAIQYEKTQAEENGLVKMDILAVAKLDVISEILRQSAKIGIELPTMEELCLEKTDDEGAYKVIQSGFTGGCFQVEGATLQPLCKPLRPTCIEDIALINALGRPSVSKKDRELFLARRDGRVPIKYPHPLLESILQPTYGISIYEEDLLKIAPDIAGWDLSEADGLRKITKLKEKGGNLAAQLEEKFVRDASERRGITKAEASMIWNDVIIGYSKYGFTKAHAIAYSMLGYVTAYYKYHARAPFFAATLNDAITGVDKSGDYMARIKEETSRFGVKIHPCDINLSKQYYVATGKKDIVTGLGAVRGLGDSALDMIVKNQPYSSFESFILKNPKKVNSTHVNALIKAGAFDGMGVSRKFASENFLKLKAGLKKALTKSADLIESMGEKAHEIVIANYIYDQSISRTDEWTLAEKLAGEREVLGEYLSGTAKDLYPEFFKGEAYNTKFTSIEHKNRGDSLLFEGIVNSVTTFTIKSGKNKGKQMGKISVENLKGETSDIVIFASQWEAYEDMIAAELPLAGEATVLEDRATKEKSWSLARVIRSGRPRRRK